MDKTAQNSECPTDYIDIVNEINDFIASLDAPPLDNHTKELVGTSERHKFGQHGGEYSSVPASGVDWNSARSRHASGEQSCQLLLAKQHGDSVSSSVDAEDPCNRSFPFPLVDDTDPGIGIYDNSKELDRSKSTEYDYSDSSSYGGVYSDASSCGDVADSDSGCYSHYQRPRLDAPAVHKDSFFRNILSSTTFSAPSSSSFPNIISGNDRGQTFLSSSSPKHQQHLRPQSPDRLSAEFHCDPDSIDQRFHQVGSSAHTLATPLGGKSSNWDPDDHDYQEPSNIPKIPESPLPKRRPPVKYTNFGEGLTSSQSPLSTSLQTQPSSQNPKEQDRDASYSTIHKQTPLSPNQSSPQKVNIKNRWPPASGINETSSKITSPLKFQAAEDKIPRKDKYQEQIKEDNLQKQQTEIEFLTPRQHPVPIPITRVPDLSVLISELRSASPRSELSPNSSYTSTARSQRAPPKTESEHQLQSDHHHSNQPTQLPSHQLRAEFLKPHQASSSQSPSRLDYQSPSHREESRVLSPSLRQPVNGVACRSDSPEHDYEPIENIQLEIPATPQLHTKFPHPQGPAMADTGGQQPKHVKALHNFKGANNDELCFKKGDIITVTQCVDGGWWEGTLNGRTGWFPSNYTKELKTDISYKNKSGDVPVYKRESMQLYHNVVLKNVIETEKTHVSEMLRVLQSYIKPLEATNLTITDIASPASDSTIIIEGVKSLFRNTALWPHGTDRLTAAEYTLLLGNVEEIIAFQQSFLAALEECEKLPSTQRRIGGIFMQFAPRVKELYSSYCANHPKAVSVLQKKREELGKFVESQGAPSPGGQTLTTILSKPFTRLDRYPSLLKELERHVEESHPDRGDTQRAIAVYRNIANSCLEIRKLKEMEYEIITSTIQGWEGEDISKLGEVIHLSQVKMITQTGEKYERIFVLFSSCLVMLSMSNRLSSYHYEGKIPLSGLTANPCESTDSFQNAFEISGPMIEKITVLCGTKMEVTAWLEILNNQVSQSGNPTSSTKPQPLQVHMTTTCQTNVSTVTSAKTAQISSNPPTAPPPQFPLTTAKTSSVWSLTCLRPSPPLRPTLMCREEVLKSPRAGRKSTHKRKPVRTYSGEETDWHSKNDPKVYNEDAFILQVIEAYCNSIKTRHTVNSCRIELAKKKPNEGKVDLSKLRLSDSSGSESGAYTDTLNSPDLDDYTSMVSGAILNSPQMLLAEEEKIFDETEQQERTVVDTVYALQDRVKELEQEQRKLRQDLEEEKRCRKKLEAMVRQQVVKSSAVDGIQDGNS